MLIVILTISLENVFMSLTGRFYLSKYGLNLSNFTGNNAPYYVQKSFSEVSEKHCTFGLRN